MFRNGLLLSTAMTAVALLLHGVPAQAQSGMHTAPPDSNTRFLCNYGQFLVSHEKAGNSGGSYYITWTHVAVPLRGRGQTVSNIIVKETGHNRKFSAGIYSDAGGEPGTLIAGGTGVAQVGCASVAIPISPTTLAKNTRYWVEETGDLYPHNTVYWAVAPRTKRKAYVQYHTSSLSHSSTTPWEKQNSGPWLRLK